MRILGPGQKENIGSPDWLTQVQPDKQGADIVDHAEKSGMPVHIVTRVDANGKTTSDVE